MSKELAKTYDPKGLEDRLYQKWIDNGYFHAKVNPDKKPFTIVMPPPNVTGQLHMGHALDETMQDIREQTMLRSRQRLRLLTNSKKRELTSMTSDVKNF